MKAKAWFLPAAGGVGVGLINGLLGAGGGMLAVPLLRRCGLSTKQAHAGSIAVIWPLCGFSGALYWMQGRVTLAEALPFWVPGAVGAVAGAFLLGRLPDRWIRRIFALFMIWAGVRLLMK